MPRPLLLSLCAVIASTIASADDPGPCPGYEDPDYARPAPCEVDPDCCESCDRLLDQALRRCLEEHAERWCACGEDDEACRRFALKLFDICVQDCTSSYYACSSDCGLVPPDLAPRPVMILTMIDGFLASP